MLALLRKDCRVNRMVLILGLMILAGPLLFGVLMNLYGLARYGVLGWPWPNLIVTTGVVSVSLSLLTITMLGGNAVAGERMDRSAEFLAYLPPSRGQVIASKAVLAVGVSIFIWLVHLAIVYGLAPLAGEISEDLMRHRDNVLPQLALIGVVMFGAAWFGSTLLDSPAIATGIGFAGPWLVLGVLALARYVLGYEDPGPGSWGTVLGLGLGIGCFIAGIAYYVRRVEP